MPCAIRLNGSVPPSLAKSLFDPDAAGISGRRGELPATSCGMCAGSRVAATSNARDQCEDTRYGASPLRGEGRPSTADEKGNAVTRSPPPPIYTAQRACGKPRVVLYNRRPMARTDGNVRGEMRVLSSTYGSRGDGEPMVRFAVRLRALGAEGLGVRL
jgi:hypothetical protein